MLRGRCYDCRSPISPRYPLVEAGVAALFVLAALRFADQPRLLPAYLAFAGIGGALALIDLDVRRLPNSIVLPSYPLLGALLALVATARHNGWDAERALRERLRLLEDEVRAAEGGS